MHATIDPNDATVGRRGICLVRRILTDCRSGPNAKRRKDRVLDYVDGGRRELTDTLEGGIDRRPRCCCKYKALPWICVHCDAGSVLLGDGHRRTRVGAGSP